MKTYTTSVTRLMRVVKTGAALVAALFAASTLQAQFLGQSSTAPPAASGETAAKISHRAKDFLQDAAQAELTEAALANIAQEKSQNTAVRELAQTLRTDHQQNYAKLESITQAHGIALGDFPNWVNQRTVNRLQKSSNPDFDKEYIKTVIKDRVACIKIFDKAVAQIGEPDVKQYAQNTLPTLRSHLRRSEETARSVGVDEATISSMLKGLPTDKAELGVAFNQN